jgi:integrase
MKELINEYITEQQGSWSESTKRSERYRLSSIVDHLSGPEQLWKYLEKNIRPYSRSTYWIRTITFYDWLQSGGHVSDGANPYREFRKKNARLFKHVYERRFPSIGFEEAQRRIETIEDRAVREACHALLGGGLRISELHTYDPGTGTVVGKGGKRRRVYCSPFSRVVSSRDIRRALAVCGLKPHDLRKIFLTAVFKSGASNFELCKIAGWSSIATAINYIQVQEDLSDLVRKATQSTASK